METAVATLWKIDTAHTEVQFKVRHLVISTVTGKFKEFTGELTTDREDFDGAGVHFEIQSASLDTNSPDRDKHLKSDDFFAVDKYPTITFNNGILKKVSGKHYQLHGDLRIRETTKAFVFEVEYQGSVVDPWGNAKVGFEITGNIHRKDYGLTWNMLAHAGALLVGEEVKIQITAELGK